MDAMIKAATRRARITPAMRARARAIGAEWEAIRRATETPVFIHHCYGDCYKGHRVFEQTFGK